MDEEEVERGSVGRGDAVCSATFYSPSAFLCDPYLCLAQLSLLISFSFFQSIFIHFSCDSFSSASIVSPYEHEELGLFYRATCTTLCLFFNEKANT